MTGKITLSGLVSDVNWTKLIEDLIKAKKASAVSPYEASKTKYGKKLEAYRELNRKILDIVNCIKEFELNSDRGYRILTYELSSSNPTLNPFEILSIQTAGNLKPGTYRIEVLTIAKKEKISSDGITSATSALGLSGTISINGKEIEILGSDTLFDVASKVNSASAQVTASVLRISESEYRLVLESEKEGSSGISILDPDDIFETLGILDSSKSKKNIITAGEDATLKIDGFLITSSTNTVTGVIPGLTLKLEGETGSSFLRLAIRPDDETQRKRIEELVKRVNALLSFIDSQSSYTPGVSKPLQGDVTLQNIKNGIVSLTFSKFDENETYKTLSSIGISFTKEGVINFDGTKFGEAIATERNGVTNLLKSFSESLLQKLNLLVDPYTGNLKRIESSLEGQLSRIEARLKELEKRFEREKEILEKKYSDLELLISRSNLIKGWMENQIKAMFKKN